MSGMDKFARLAALKPARAAAARPATLRAPEDADELAQLLGASVAKNRFGDHLAVRNWFSTPEFADPSPVALEILSRTRDESASRRTRAAIADPSQWLFLDTETTGLAGGTGTYAFLVGLAWWDAGGLQTEQFFLRDFSEEHSLLHELAARLAERPVLVTFNGKSFDWPLLESRFTMTRAIPAPRLAAHLDLLHPARALWKLRLGSVRLIELERHVLDAPRLGWRREDDVPSALIPQFYFDYLRGGPAAPLVSVARHNQMDLRGLAALFGKINTLLSTESHQDPDIHSLDLFGLSRYLDRRGEVARAHTVCERALECGLPAEFRPQAHRDLAVRARRRGDHAAAAALWKQLLADPRDALHACEQLAIYYERRAKDPARAMEYARLGLKKAQLAQAQAPHAWTASAIVLRAARMQEKFQQRLARLEHQMQIQLGAAPPPLLTRSKSAAGPAGRPRAR
ncbi:MAG: ribonuclease H-like domain-containing protein [Acidobacteriia bacterium]|nr:ribonuclease H-like domain-containing protein [Terriglobia bacterium]